MGRAGAGVLPLTCAAELGLYPVFAPEAQFTSTEVVYGVPEKL